MIAANESIDRELASSFQQCPSYCRGLIAYFLLSQYLLADEVVGGPYYPMLS